MTLSRRSLLLGAPAVVLTSGLLMPLRGISMPVRKMITLYTIDGDHLATLPMVERYPGEWIAETPMITKTVTVSTRMIYDGKTGFIDLRNPVLTPGSILRVIMSYDDEA